MRANASRGHIFGAMPPPPFKAVLRSDRRVIAYIRGCFYLEVERWTPTVSAEPPCTQAGRGHPALAEQKQPRALAELGVRRDHIAGQLESLILTAQALEATADAAEARYKEVVAVNAKLATTSDQLRYSLHQANVRIRNLERALQAKDEELEQARRGNAVRAPDPAAYARVYDLRGRPMFLP
ncbi:hypothetical protein PHLGIDRAFT_25163 [Phlebiopsis gigantea 11061_1 CR5-6]|uniref:Uncharacterized protein n=1 Tax=Phlebiopsis gigantea (strain 11061_1 CR5-6) TaxID=745531 RepID=A0A0C3PHG4_PHLG1|nr:hypothetical protein PHLGIDRAFT_25163 [Phlebiopsis gigantea 11061_1 CR5-6]